MSDKKTIIKDFQAMKPSVAFKQLDFSKLPKEVRDKIKLDLSQVSNDTLDLQFDQSTFKKWVETFSDLYPAAFGIKEEKKVTPVVVSAPADESFVSEGALAKVGELDGKIKDLKTRISIIKKMILKQPKKRVELKIRLKTVEKMIVKFEADLKIATAELKAKPKAKKKIIKKSIGGLLFGEGGDFISKHLSDLKNKQKKIRFDLGGTMQGNKKYKYSVTFQTITPESAEAGDYESQGFEVEETIEELQDILQDAVNNYGIYMPNDSYMESWGSQSPDTDRDYFEKGIEKYYSLHIKNIDDSALTSEEAQFITDKLKEGRHLHWDDEDKNWWREGGEIHSEDKDGILMFKADTKGGKYSIEVREGSNVHGTYYDIYEFTNGKSRGMGVQTNKELLMHKIIDTIIGSKKIDGINYIVSFDNINVKEYLPALEKIWDIYNSSEYREWFKKQNETLTEEQKQSLSDEIKNKTIKYVKDNDYKENDSTVGAFFNIFGKEKLIKDFYKSKGQVILKDGGEFTKKITIKDVDEWDVINDWASWKEISPKYNVSYGQIVNDINDIGAINDLDDLESYKKGWKERYNLKSTDDETIEKLANDLWRDVLESARKDNAFENYVKELNEEKEKGLLDIPENYNFIRHDRNTGGGDYIFMHRNTKKELKLPDWRITEMGGAGGTDMGYVSREAALKNYFSKDKYSEGGGLGTGYNVFNYTDNIYASPDIFKSKKDAKDFITQFRKRYEAQGYYKDNRLNKINPKDIDLEIIPEDFSPFKKGSEANVELAEGGSIGSLQKELDEHKELSFELYPSGDKMSIENGLYGILVNGKLRNTKYIGQEYCEIDGVVYKNDKKTKLILQKGGTIDSDRRFTDSDFTKLTDSKKFDVRFDVRLWKITESGRTSIVGKFNPKTKTLFIFGKKDNTNPLVKWLSENSFVSADEYDKLENGGGLEDDSNKKVVTRVYSYKSFKEDGIDIFRYLRSDTKYFTLDQTEAKVNKEKDLLIPILKAKHPHFLILTGYDADMNEKFSLELFSCFIFSKFGEKNNAARKHCEEVLSRNYRRTYDGYKKFKEGGSVEGEFPFKVTALNKEGVRVDAGEYVSKSAANKYKNMIDPKHKPKVEDNIKLANVDEVGEWKSGTTIKFKTKKEANHNLDLKKNHNESDTKFRNLRVDKINGDKLNEGYVVRFEYLKENKLANGGGLNSDNTPKVYISDLAAYNEGTSVGEWIDLSDFSSGEEVMDKIQELLAKWSEEQKVEREEYSVNDFENFPEKMYSDSMGEESFQKVIDYYEAVKDADYPTEVIEEYASQTGNDIADAVSNMDDAYQGKFSSSTDLAKNWVDSVGGIGGVQNPENYITVSDTDRRLVANEQADGDVDNMDDDDILERADLKTLYDNFVERAEELEGQEDLDDDDRISILESEFEYDDAEKIIEEAKKIVHDEIYEEWYEGLNDPYNFLVEEQGIYDSSNIMNASFVMFDYDKFGEDLEQDYLSIDHDGETYYFLN